MDVVKQQPSAGVLGFEISAQQWSDGATSKRWLGLTSNEPVLIYPNDVPIPGSMFSRRMEFPANAVLVRSISLPVVDGSTTKEKLIETQLLHFDGKNWAGTRMPGTISKPMLNWYRPRNAEDVAGA